jgi:hypothetical protein
MNFRIQNAIKATMLLCFGVLLALPGLQMVFQFVKEAPVQEYRKLAEPPDDLPLADTHAFKTARRAFENWFNDHLGFRATLLRLGNEVRLHLFKTNDLVYVGSDDWLFYKTFYTGAWAASQSSADQHAAEVAERWRRLNEWLAQRGIHLIVVDIPLKHFIYSEHLPPEVVPIEKPTRWDRFRAFMDANGIDRLDVEPILLAGKQKYQVYQKTDLHWSIYGGCDTARALVNKISRLEYGQDMKWRHDYKWKPGPLEDIGTEARAIPLLRNIVEPYDTAEPDGRIGTPALDITADNPYDRIYHNDGDQLLPVTVSLNDSFFSTMEICGFGKHFQTLATGRTLYRPEAGLAAVLRKIPEGTRYFIMEYMENNVEFVNPEPLILPGE